MGEFWTWGWWVFKKKRFYSFKTIPTWKRMKPAAALWLTVFQMAVGWFSWEIEGRRCTQWTRMTPYASPVSTHHKSSLLRKERTGHTANVGCVARKGSDMTPAGIALIVPASHHSVTQTASWTTTLSLCIGRLDQALSGDIPLVNNGYHRKPVSWMVWQSSVWLYSPHTWTGAVLLMWIRNNHIKLV